MTGFFLKKIIFFEFGYLQGEMGEQGLVKIGSKVSKPKKILFFLNILGSNDPKTIQKGSFCGCRIIKLGTKNSENY